MAIPTYKREQLLDLISQKLAGSPNTIDASEHRELEEAIVNAIYGQIGDIKEIACTAQYISDNFIIDPNSVNEGLGKSTGERYGWAICNGKNGTIDKRGNVSIGYDPINYPTLAQLGGQGKQGGDKTHTLSVTEMPPHSHTRPRGNDNNLGGGSTQYGWQAIDDLWGSYATSITGGAGSTSTGNTTGGSTVPHNNMQPYIVTLFIQRIAV